MLSSQGAQHRACAGGNIRGQDRSSGWIYNKIPINYSMLLHYSTPCTKKSSGFFSFLNILPPRFAIFAIFSYFFAKARKKRTTAEGITKRGAACCILRKGGRYQKCGKSSTKGWKKGQKSPFHDTRVPPKCEKGLFSFAFSHQKWQEKRGPSPSFFLLFSWVFLAVFLRFSCCFLGFGRGCSALTPYSGSSAPGCW